MPRRATPSFQSSQRHLVAIKVPSRTRADISAVALRASVIGNRRCNGRRRSISYRRSLNLSQHRRKICFFLRTQLHHGDFGSCSRWSRRRARNSSPGIGCVLGVARPQSQAGHELTDLRWDQIDFRTATPEASRPCPVGYQDHGRIPVAVAVLLVGFNQPFDLRLRQMLAVP